MRQTAREEPIGCRKKRSSTKLRFGEKKGKIEKKNSKLKKSVRLEIQKKT